MIELAIHCEYLVMELHDAKMGKHKETATIDFMFSGGPGMWNLEG